MLFIAMPSPKKENFMNNHRDALSGILYNLGVGGTFDLIAGVTRRAPRWMQRNGLEWFYRLIQEPRRMWKRYLIGNAGFIFLVLRARLRAK
jgi:N-acetylglucosaminyldiphosphoundecaprenol N-acetyl-beta-D-mannosaminyltransferase